MAEATQPDTVGEDDGGDVIHSAVRRADLNSSAVVRHLGDLRTDPDIAATGTDRGGEGVHVGPGST